MPSAPTYDIEVAQTVIQFGVEVQTGSVYQVQMQLGTGPAGSAATIEFLPPTTLPAGSPATAENVGTPTAAVVQLGIPSGHDGTGTVNGPASAVDGHMATFDGTSGKLLKDGGAPPVPPAPATTAPADLAAAAAVGTSTKYSREDHAHKKPTPAEIGAPTVNDPRFVGVPVATKTAAYTLVAGDAGSIVEVNTASAVNVTVPPSLFAAGQIVEVCQYGAGQVTIVAGSGVTLRNANGLKISAQYGSASIRFRSATEAVVAGSMTT